MKGTFNGKKVLITGAAGGLGTELCLAFGTKGATIIAIDINLERLQTWTYPCQVDTFK
ncbi:SDR family NAD(P)-dependent oxidoreductase [Bacillus sp. 165]|uniref:SDR family NAD(P)-dependent oxidoreductase n=1 Tax=Bacillus sp. 165 TaxID=1529117 RepID=UPI001ADA2B84|nr:SDR family NAD(P)-dependent oxidoreductase [Bacillus sp. 165]MBO9131479.1 SDR family NAD(P)-dependent oxidoreductase [Bacillus sp. 165]